MRDYTNESGASERRRTSETDPPSQRSDGETSDELVPQRATQTRRSTRASLPDDKDNFVNEALRAGDGGWEAIISSKQERAVEGRGASSGKEILRELRTSELLALRAGVREQRPTRQRDRR